MDRALHLCSLVGSFYYLEVTKNHYLLSYFATRGDNIGTDTLCKASFCCKTLGRRHQKGGEDPLISMGGIKN